LLFIKICGFRVRPFKQLALSLALTNQWVSFCALSVLRWVRKLHISQQLHLAKQASRLFPRLALQLHSFFTSLIIKTTDNTRTTKAADPIASQHVSRPARPSLRRFSEEVL